MCCIRGISVGEKGCLNSFKVFKRDVSAGTSSRARAIQFKISEHDRQRKVELTPSNDSSTWEMIKTLLPHQDKSMDPANRHEARVLKAFELKVDDVLHIPPSKHLPTPFEYHSTVNDDKSYIVQPRLSVTKLLTTAWCELRNFYEVYAGSPRMEPSSSMKTGVKYHARLELEQHPKRDAVTLKEQIYTLLARHSSESRKVLTRTKEIHSFAQGWIEQIISRTISASYSKVARELFIHGFLDLQSGSLVTDRTVLRYGVLVNGIADVVKIDQSNALNHNDDGGVKPPSVAVGSKCEVLLDKSPPRVWDLAAEIAAAKKKMSNLSEDHYLHMRDVKTRKSNTVPSQTSAIEAAKLQCMYYAKFLDNLSKDAEFAYESCLENFIRRRVHPDEPLSVALAVELIIVNFRTIAIDCIRLAKGDDIGFLSFDRHVHDSRSYSLSQFITETEFKSLLETHYGSELDLSSLDLSSLFEEWKTPLSLRYVAARAAQTYNIYESFKPSSVCVEYHNPSSRQVIARLHHPYDEDEIESSIHQSCKLWNGQRRPTSTDDPSMCNHCNFRGRCSAINSKISSEFSTHIHRLQD